MIELYSRTIQLATRNGRTLLCDPEKLQEDLRQAFFAAGIGEAWPAEQVLAVIREQAMSADQLVDSDEEAAFDELLISLLSDAGYPEVAAEYSLRRNREGSHVETFSQACRPWDEARLRQEIARSVRASRLVCDKLTGLVGRKLDALGFAEVSDSLIVEVARHTLGALARAYRKEPAGDGDWLMPPAYWEAFFTGKSARLAASGAVRIHPLSDLFPVLRVTVDAERVVRCLQDDNRKGHGTFVQFWDYCAYAIAETVAAVAREARPMLTRNPHHPVLVCVKRLADAVEGVGGRISKRALKAAAKDAVHALGQTVSCAGIKAIVSAAGES